MHLHYANAVEGRLDQVVKTVVSKRWVLVCAVAGIVCLAAPASAEAYVGPGAGFALLGSFATVFMAVGAAMLYMLTWPIRWLWRLLFSRRAYAKSRVKRIVIVGLDGLDADLTEKLLEEGKLPSFAKLAEQGSYVRLGTVTPPLSPVAWSSFLTGCNPGKHNIYDFLNRDTKTYMPGLSSVRIRQPTKTLKLGGYEIPLNKPEITPLRKSKPFWKILGEHGVFSNVIRVPISFPPEKFRGLCLSAMCLPDLRGTQGTFSFFTTDKASAEEDIGGERFHAVREGNVVKCELAGPTNSLLRKKKTMTVPFTVTIDEAKKTGTIRIQDTTITLPEKKLSDWVCVTFKPGLGIKVRGICRMYIRNISPEFELYVSALNIDPSHPAMPISHPGVYATYLAKLFGDYATLGLAEDTWSLNARVFDEDAFLEQAYSIHEEREKQFFDALKKTRRGFVVCVFDGTDRIQHMFWRFQDDKHPNCPPPEENRHRDVIRDMYLRMDELVGRIMDKVANDPDTLLIVMSDHGFKPFRRGVDLNVWLERNGYLARKSDSNGEKYLQTVDWFKTKAYAQGLAGIYINQDGREAKGIVAASEAEALKQELIEKLGGLQDDSRGETAISHVYDRAKVYKGPYVGEAPDLVIGFNSGYHVSWDTAVGRITDKIFHDNMRSWSGDHCIDPPLVPGILLANRSIDEKDVNIVDLAPSVLDLFGIRPPAHMDGKPIFNGNGSGK